MKYTKDTITGSLLHDFGISTNTLEKTRIIFIPYVPFPAFTLPSVFGNAIIFMYKNKLNLNKELQVKDKKSLGFLLYQYCHAHQVLEWGSYFYLWRHFYHKIFSRRIPKKHTHVERECYACVDNLMTSDMEIHN